MITLKTDDIYRLEKVTLNYSKLLLEADYFSSIIQEDIKKPEDLLFHVKLIKNNIRYQFVQSVLEELKIPTTIILSNAFYIEYIAKETYPVSYIDIIQVIEKEYGIQVKIEIKAV